MKTDHFESFRDHRQDSGRVYSVAVMTLILLVIGGVLGTFVNFAPIKV
ncbi:MAG: hypothetical protein ACLRTQ_05365 [Candidatus Borkfalkia sp.]